MFEGIHIKLDADLKDDLQKTLQSKRLNWAFLPATLQLRILRPFLKAQEEREAELMEVAGAA